jgi:hypothetical protein
MQEQELTPLEAQRLIVKTFNDHPEELGEVTLPRNDFFGKLFKRKRIVAIQLRGISSGVSQDIALRLMEMMGAKDIEGLPSSDQILTLLGSNTKPLADAIAMAIQNDTDKPYDDLSRAILYQFTNGQIHEMLKLVYGRLDLEPFFGSLTLARSLVLNLTQGKELLGQ